MSALWKSYEVQVLKLSQPDHKQLHEWETYAALNYNGPMPILDLQEA